MKRALFKTSAYTALRVPSPASSSESYVLAIASAIAYLVSRDKGLNEDLVAIGDSLVVVNTINVATKLK